MNIGIIASSGGSVFAEVYHLVRGLNKEITFFVVTDRACEIEEFCLKNGISHIRIVEMSNELFSDKASGYFKEKGGVDFVMLFFLRIIGVSIYRVFPTFNLHPSLLPAFKGFNPIGQVLRSGSRFFGATLHLVDESVDGGQIIAQIQGPVLSKEEFFLQKVSFLQKIYLSILLLELIETKSMRFEKDSHQIIMDEKLNHTYFSNPTLSNKTYIDWFNSIQARELINIFSL